MDAQKSLIAPFIKDIFKDVKSGWRKIILSPELKPILNACFKKIDARLRENGITKDLVDKNGLKTYLRPSPDKIFECFKYCEPEDARVCIMGQDPYPNPQDAMGLSFSTPADKKTLAKSIANIYKAMINTQVLSEMPKTGDLTNWAKQGVILLNRYLTRNPNIIKNEKGEIWVEGNGDSDKKYMHLFWGDFTGKLMEYFSRNYRCIFLLWGVEARKLKDVIINSEVMEWSHPVSYMADSNPDSFVQCRHFADVNARLVGLNLPIINWNPTQSEPKVKPTVANGIMERPVAINLLMERPVAKIEPTIKPVLANSDVPIVVFVDGGCSDNGDANAVSSCGIYFPKQWLGLPTAMNKTIKISHLLLRKTYKMTDDLELQTTNITAKSTNCRAEMLGAIIALIHIIKYYKTNAIKHRIILIQDATYSIMFMSCRVWKYLKSDPGLKKDRDNLDLCQILKRLLYKLVDVVPIKDVPTSTDSTSIHQVLIHPSLREESKYGDADKTVAENWPGLTVLYQKSHLTKKQIADLQKVGGMAYEKYVGNEMVDEICTATVKIAGADPLQVHINIQTE